MYFCITGHLYSVSMTVTISLGVFFLTFPLELYEENYPPVSYTYLSVVVSAFRFHNTYPLLHLTSLYGMGSKTTTSDRYFGIFLTRKEGSSILVLSGWCLNLCSSAFPIHCLLLLKLARFTFVLISRSFVGLCVRRFLNKAIIPILQMGKLRQKEMKGLSQFCSAGHLLNCN